LSKGWLPGRRALDAIISADAARRRTVRDVNQAEAQAVVAALDRESSYPTRDRYVLARREAVESYAAEQSDDGSWRVVLCWTHGDERFGVVVAELTDTFVAGDEPTAEQAALDLRMLYVEESQSAEGRRDIAGRVWVEH
jgi:hypothetical protein